MDQLEINYHLNKKKCQIFFVIDHVSHCSWRNYDSNLKLKWHDLVQKVFQWREKTWIESDLPPFECLFTFKSKSNFFYVMNINMNQKEVIINQVYCIRENCCHHLAEFLIIIDFFEIDSWKILFAHKNLMPKLNRV